MRMLNEEIIELYKEDMYNNDKSKNTVEGYVNHVKAMLQYVDKSLYDINYVDIQKYITYLKNEVKNTVTSINNKKSGLNSFFRYIKKIGVIESEIHLNTHKDKFKKQRSDDKDRMKADMYYTIIENNESYFASKPKTERNIKDRAIMQLLAHGLRRDEIRNMKTNAVSLVNGKCELRIMYSKRDKCRTIYLDKKVFDIINDWVELKNQLGYDCEYLICTSNNKKLNDKESLLPSISKRLTKRGNIVINGEKITFSCHEWRHACCSIMAKNGVAPIEIAVFAGDTLQTILDNYIHKEEKSSVNVASGLMNRVA